MFCYSHYSRQRYNTVCYLSGNTENNVMIGLVRLLQGGSCLHEIKLRRQRTCGQESLLDLVSYIACLKKKSFSLTTLRE